MISTGCTQIVVHPVEVNTLVEQSDQFKHAGQQFPELWSVTTGIRTCMSTPESSLVVDVQIPLQGWNLLGQCLLPKPCIP